MRCVCNSAQRHSQFASRTNLVTSRPVQNLATAHTFDSTLRRCLARHFSARAWAECFIFSRALVCALQTAQRRMVSERAIQLWVVRTVFRSLPFLAALAGPAGARSQKSEVRGQKSDVNRFGNRDCFAPSLLPVRLFEIANPEWRLLAWVHAAAVVTLTLLLIWCAGGSSVAPPFCISGRIHFRCGAMANSSGSSRHSGADAHRRPRRRRNSDAPWNSRASRGQPDSREQRTRRRKRSVQRHSFIANSTNDRLAFWRTETAFGFAPRRARRRRCCDRASRQFYPRRFFGQVAATKSISEVGRWHDIAGYTIIALVFVGTMGLAYWLGRKKPHCSGRACPERQSNGLSPAESGCSGTRVACKSQPARLPLQFPAFYLAGGPLLALACRDWNCGMVSRSRTQSCQRGTLGVCVGPNSRRIFANSRSTQKFGASSGSTRARQRHGR